MPSSSGVASIPRRRRRPPAADVARARTVFLGSGAFAVPVLAAVAAAPELSLEAVVTAPPRPAGRRAELAATAVGTAAVALGRPILTPERLRDPAFLEAFAALRPDVGVLADYGKILPAALLDLAPHGILNVHPSLLPRHRGATPIPAAILAGDTTTGVSLFRMDPGMDTGPLVAVGIDSTRSGRGCPRSRTAPRRDRCHAGRPLHRVLPARRGRPSSAAGGGDHRDSAARARRWPARRHAPGQRPRAARARPEAMAGQLRGAGGGAFGRSTRGRVEPGSGRRPGHLWWPTVPAWPLRPRVAGSCSSRSGPPVAARWTARPTGAGTPPSSGRG